VCVMRTSNLLLGIWFHFWRSAAPRVR
jgi:hypothetical protein